MFILTPFYVCFFRYDLSPISVLVRRKKNLQEYKQIDIFYYDFSHVIWLATTPSYEFERNRKKTLGFKIQLTDIRHAPPSSDICNTCNLASLWEEHLPDSSPSTPPTLSFLPHSPFAFPSPPSPHSSPSPPPPTPLLPLNVAPDESFHCIIYA